MNEEKDNEESMMKNLFELLKQDDSVVRVQLNDQRLMRLAEYDATHGFMKMKVTPEELQGRFFELKGLVKKGSFTLKSLEDDVYTRWGIPEEAREKALQKESTKKNKEYKIGFCLDDVYAAEIPDNSSENH